MFLRNGSVFGTHGAPGRFFWEMTCDVSQVVYIKGGPRNKAGHGREQRAGVSVEPALGEAGGSDSQPVGLITQCNDALKSLQDTDAQLTFSVALCKAPLMDHVVHTPWG